MSLLWCGGVAASHVCLRSLLLPLSGSNGDERRSRTVSQMKMIFSSRGISVGSPRRLLERKEILALRSTITADDQWGLPKCKECDQ